MKRANSTSRSEVTRPDGITSAQEEILESYFKDQIYWTKFSRVKKAQVKVETKLTDCKIVAWFEWRRKQARDALAANTPLKRARTSPAITASGTSPSTRSQTVTPYHTPQHNFSSQTSRFHRTPPTSVRTPAQPQVLTSYTLSTLVVGTFSRFTTLESPLLLSFAAQTSTMTIAVAFADIWFFADFPKETIESVTLVERDDKACLILKRAVNKRPGFRFWKYIEEPHDIVDVACEDWSHESQLSLMHTIICGLSFEIALFDFLCMLKEGGIESKFIKDDASVELRAHVPSQELDELRAFLPATFFDLQESRDNWISSSAKQASGHVGPQQTSSSSSLSTLDKPPTPSFVRNNDFFA
ncbi:hypothetical protein BT69DRAFT_1349423 [Atractiella rhizophila]|nr:hypothetical protein BT69DRAFT_1349423 [Atractiella rhizophila]